MSKRIRKLTPLLLKRIIKEEKQKLARKKSKKVTKHKKVSSTSLEIKMLNESRKKQVELVRKFKELYMLRKKLKRKLIKRL
jgi:hypothetical protein